MKNKVISLKTIGYIVLFFALIMLFRTFLLYNSYKSNEAEKWGYYNYDEDHENIPINIFLNMESYNNSIGITIADEWVEIPITSTEVLINRLKESDYFSYKKKDLLKIDKYAIYGKYKAIYFKSNETDSENFHIRKIAIMLIKNSVFIVQQNSNREFTIYKSKDNSLYKYVDDYFNMNFRLDNQS